MRGKFLRKKTVFTISVGILEVLKKQEFKRKVINKMPILLTFLNVFCQNT